MRLSPAPELAYGKDVPSAIAASVGSPDEVARWLVSLRTLARSTAAAGAFALEGRELAPALDAFRARLSSGAFVASVEEYAGLPFPGTHRIVLSPFHSAAGVANVVTDRDDGSVSVTSLFGPDRQGAAPEYWTVRVPGTLWHEESHGILDPLAVAWSERIARAKPADASAICYGDWRQCVREHVVRAVMIRMIARKLGPDAAAEQLAFEGPARFRWLVKMIAALKEYEADRARWPTLADFYPRLLDAIQEEPEDARPPFRPELEPAPVRARLARLARAALPKMRDADARRHLKRALALAEAPLDFASGPSLTDPKAAALSARGIKAFSAGRKDEALRLFDAALKADPDDAEAAMSRAVVLEALGRGADALADYGRAAASARRRKEAYPPHVLADALSSRARLLLAAGRKTEARRDLEAALAAAPRSWDGRADAEKQLKASR